MWVQNYYPKGSLSFFTWRTNWGSDIPNSNGRFSFPIFCFGEIWWCIEILPGVHQSFKTFTPFLGRCPNININYNSLPSRPSQQAKRGCFSGPSQRGSRSPTLFRKWGGSKLLQPQPNLVITASKWKLTIENGFHLNFEGSFMKFSWVSRRGKSF